MLKQKYSKFERLYFNFDLSTGQTIELAGDCDFNFNDKKLKYYQTIVNKEDEKLLLYCAERARALCNFSIMPITGGINNYKGSCFQKLDRLDTFIFLLSCYYACSNDCALSKQITNFNSTLETYLDTYSDIYDYCHNIYFIDNKLVDELVLSGKLPIKNGDDLKRYMNLAKQVWDSKVQHISNVGNHCDADTVILCANTIIEQSSI